jgi:hypothetical protein
MGDWGLIRDIGALLKKDTAHVRAYPQRNPKANQFKGMFSISVERGWPRGPVMIGSVY